MKTLKLFVTAPIPSQMFFYSVQYNLSISLPLSLSLSLYLNLILSFKVFISLQISLLFLILSQSLFLYSQTLQIMLKEKLSKSSIYMYHIYFIKIVFRMLNMGNHIFNVFILNLTWAVWRPRATVGDKSSI